MLIETRSAGEVCCVPPADGYQFITGNVDQIPRLTDEEVEDLISTSRKFNQIPSMVKAPSHSKPGDWYDQQDLWRDVATNVGWRLDRT